MKKKQMQTGRSPDPVSTPAGAGQPRMPRRSGTTDVRSRQDAHRRNLFLLACFVLFALLTTIRVLNIVGKSPEYDEIWTVEHYTSIPVWSVFTDVATPNNHVLNSLGIRFFLSVIPCQDTNLPMRMTALLGFCGLFLLLLRASLLLLKHDAARGAVLAVVLLNGMILHYAETARGYSLQSWVLFGQRLSLLCYQLRPPENRTFNAGMWLLCALGTCLSVSSGALYVAILTGLWGLLYVPFRDGIGKIWKDNRPLILAGGLWSIFALAWYGGNYSQFEEGRAMFGQSFQTPAQYLTYCFEAARETGLLWVLPFLAAGGVLLRGKPQWRICALTGGTVVLMFASALVTAGGPPRIYLALFAPAVFGVGIAADELLTDNPKLRRISLLLLLVLAGVCVFFSDRMRKQAADPDMAVVFREAAKLDPHVFISYKPTDLYVLQALLKDAVEEDDFNRQTDPRMLLLLHDNLISSVHVGNPPVEEFMAPGAAPVSEDYMVPGEKVRFWLYRLRPIQPGERLDGKVVLCFANKSIREETNLWLLSHFGVVNSIIFRRNAARVCFAASGTGLDSDALLELEQNNPGTLFFRVVTD